VRLALFVAAFAPDEIVEAGGSGGVAEELFPGAFDISDIASRGGPLRLVGAARERLASLAVRLRDEDGLPIRAWTRAAVLDPAGGVHTGIIGRNLEGARFFSDDTLDVERLRGSDLVLMPAGHRWTASSGLDLREGGAVDVMLAPISPSPWHLRLRLPDGAPAAGRPVFAGLPFGAAVPRAAVSVGTTDEDGALTTGFLPPGLHAIGAPFEGSEMAGVKAGALLGPEAFAGRIAWTRCEVRDGGQLDLTVPAR
jgi:hypothetical protein